MLKKTSYRRLQSLMLFVTISVLVFSFYIEFLNQIQPCPLCVMQRLCAFLFGFFCIMGLGLNSLKRAKRMVLVQCILAGLGLYFSGRQLWLQSLLLDQPHTTQCMPGLEAMLHYFSWSAIFKSFFWGTSDCSHVDWRWFGVTIPAWSALYYCGIFALSVYLYGAISVSLKRQSKF